MRIRRGTIQTPVMRFSDQAGARTVTLIGTMHVGEPRYFQQVHDLASRLEARGAVVQYEMVRPSSEADWAAATAQERAAREAHNARAAVRGNENPLLAGVQRYLGWAYQGQALEYLPHWRNTDISTLEYVQLTGPEHILASEDASARALDSLGDVGVAGLSGPGAVLLFRLLALDRYRIIARLVGREPSDRARAAVIVDARNRTALHALPPAGDSVMIWGADHLAGLRAGLRAAGFARAGRTRWLDVGTLPGVWVCVCDFRAAVRQVKVGMLEQGQALGPGEAAR